jgi:hypothetical protein
LLMLICYGLNELNFLHIMYCTIIMPLYLIVKLSLRCVCVSECPSDLESHAIYDLGNANEYTIDIPDRRGAQLTL